MKASGITVAATLVLMALPAAASGVCNAVENADKTPPCVEVRHSCHSLHCVSRTITFDCPTRPSGRSVVLRHNDYFNCKGSTVNIHGSSGLNRISAPCAGKNEKGRIAWVSTGLVSGTKFETSCVTD